MTFPTQKDLHESSVRLHDESDSVYANYLRDEDVARRLIERVRRSEYWPIIAGTNIERRPSVQEYGLNSPCYTVQFRVSRQAFLTNSVQVRAFRSFLANLVQQSDIINGR